MFVSFLNGLVDFQNSQFHVLAFITVSHCLETRLPAESVYTSPIDE